MKRRVLAAICISTVLAVSGCSGAADTAENTTAENIEEDASSSQEDIQNWVAETCLSWDRQYQAGNRSEKCREPL